LWGRQNRKTMSKSLKYILLAVSVFAALGIGYSMFALYQAEQEWSYLPLGLLLFGWAAKLLASERWFSRMPHKWHLIGLATLSGVLLAFGFPPVPFTLLMFVGFVPLLLIEDAISRHFGRTAKWEVFKYAFHGFLVWNILTTYWVLNTSFIPGVVALSLNSVFMAIPFVGFHWTKHALNERMGYLAFISYWLTFEYVHLNWEITWPWLTLGNSFATFPSWAQWYEWTGAFGGSLWILIVNLIIFNIIRNKKITETNVRQWLLPGLSVALPIAVSLVIYYNYTEKGQQVEVVVVQPNYNPHYEKFAATYEEQLARYIRLSKTQVTDSTDYLVFPETSFYLIDEDNILGHPTMRGMMDFVRQYPHLHLVTGIIADKRLDESAATRPSVRMQARAFDTIYYERYNASVQLSSDTGEIPFYKKSKLVPGPEILPYSQYLFFLRPLVDQLGGSMAGHGTQPERSVFNSPEGTKVGTMICYESIFGEYAGGYLRKGANFMTIITNDGWWDDTGGYRQHLRFAALRAIEGRRAIARSANTGSSCFINQRGDISQATDYGVEAAIKGNLTLNDRLTFYTIWGDLIARIALFTTIILLLNSVARRLSRNKV
jgi:apolipoprotein N-acyltransferase